MDNWDDWAKYNTLYHLEYVDSYGDVRSIGQVKIGEFGMPNRRRGHEYNRPALPKQFEQLNERFFSLGQDISYYDNLNDLGADLRRRILTALNDIALDQELFSLAIQEDVTGISLLRSVTRKAVEGQFRRIARGGARLTGYSFRYEAPRTLRQTETPPTLTFKVKPGSQPPTNIHVLIGRNGVGKTTLLDNMSQALSNPHAKPGDVGHFSDDSSQDPISPGFANLVSVTFSAFDPFEPLKMPQNRSEGLPYSYVGLKQIRTNASSKPLPPKTPRALAREFSMSVKICLKGARLYRWRRALQMLEADPIFSDARVADLANFAQDDAELRENATETFRHMSSGHKIVLLTITRLVETVEEQSLVLLDEPEAHLHPPLLSAFIRALSDLVVDRNGVAVVATHSPVVLQEVPRNCVWKLRRSGHRLVAERPEIETFGENVGILTREVFGLEVTQSGFHRLLRDAVASGERFDGVVADFSGELGAEARAIVRGLIEARARGDRL